MGKIIKKCLACGTLNAYDAEECKNVKAHYWQMLTRMMRFWQ